jgi:hypothetical protein
MKLCKPCHRVNLLSFFTSTPPKKTVLCTLAHAENCQSCAICRIFQYEIIPIPIGKARRKAIIEVQQEVLDDEDYLRTTDVSPVYRICFTVKQVGKDTEWTKEFDICFGHPDPSVAHPAGNTGWRMIRQPVGRCFSTDLALEWLRYDQKDQKDLTPKMNSNTMLDDVVSKGDLRHEGKSFVLSSLIAKGQFRLIDVVTGDVVVIRTAVKYIALSYVWGRFQDQTQYMIPLAERTKDIAWRIDLLVIPRTLEDAVLLVRKLGESYIWIDSLCINQSSAEDKAAIVPAMDGIYGNAHLTIVAAGGASADTGLAGLRIPRLYPEEPIEFEDYGKKLSFVPTRPGFDHLLEQSVWNTRGWTYQEYVLSSRCIFFTASEVLFAGHAGIQQREAFSMERTQRNSSNMTIRRTGKQLTTRDFLLRSRDHGFGGFSMWERYKPAVETFSSRSLTDAGDRLDAFTGALNYLVPEPNSRDLVRALSGLVYLPVRDRGDRHCMDNFTQALLWRPRARSCAPQDRIPINATKTSALPSWSWTGWLVPIDIEDSDTWSRWNRGFPELVPRLLNENNIQCEDTTGEEAARWPFDPRVCKLSPTQGVILHLWLPVLKCVLRRESNITPIDGFRLYRIHIKEPAYDSDEEGHCGGTNDTEIYVGQIVLHDDFVPTLADTTTRLETDKHSSGTPSALIQEDKLDVEMLLFCRKPADHTSQRRGRLMLVRRFEEHMERVALSHYCECEDQTLSFLYTYQHIKLI